VHNLFQVCSIYIAISIVDLSLVILADLKSLVYAQKAAIASTSFSVKKGRPSSSAINPL
jgi:hypothetical protein